MEVEIRNRRSVVQQVEMLRKWLLPLFAAARVQRRRCVLRLRRRLRLRRQSGTTTEQEETRRSRTREKEVEKSGNTK